MYVHDNINYINYHQRASSGISSYDALNSGSDVIQMHGGHFIKPSTGHNNRGIFCLFTMFPSNDGGGTSGSPY